MLRRDEQAKKDVEIERLRMAIRDNIVTPEVRANGFGAIDPVRMEEAIAPDRARLHVQGEAEGGRGVRRVVPAAGGGAPRELGAAEFDTLLTSGRAQAWAPE